MKDFIFDIKIFHKWVGHYLFKSFAKFTAISLLMSLLFTVLNILFTPAVPWFFIVMLPVVIAFSCILSYFMMFLEDRGEIKAVKKEIRMESKYPSLFTKFNKTF